MFYMGVNMLLGGLNEGLVSFVYQLLGRNWLFMKLVMNVSSMNFMSDIYWCIGCFVV